MTRTRSPRQNRVDPFGRIVADPARGTLMGNRGRLHDHRQRIVRSTAQPAWISCALQHAGFHRQIMSPTSYTELFFFDEPTALAAGHRPCGRCREDALLAFKRAWQQAFGLARLPYVGEIDPVLRGAERSADAEPSSLPDGTMIVIDHAPHLLWRGAAKRWSFADYGDPAPVPNGPVAVITSAPILAVLRAGYTPIVHPSADCPPA